MNSQNYTNHIGSYRIQQILKIVQSVLAIAFIVCLFFIPFFNYTTTIDGNTFNLKFSVFDELKLIFNQLKANNFVVVEIQTTISLLILISALIVLASTLVSLIVTIVNSIIHISTIDNSTLLAYDDIIMCKGKHLSNRNDFRKLFVAMIYLVAYYLIQHKVQLPPLSELLGGAAGNGGAQAAASAGIIAGVALNNAATSTTLVLSHLSTLTGVNALVAVVGGLLVLYLGVSLAIAIINRKIKLAVLREKYEESQMKKDSYPMD